jgi:hypothetical protein
MRHIIGLKPDRAPIDATAVVALHIDTATRSVTEQALGEADVDLVGDDGVAVGKVSREDLLAQAELV